MKNRIEDAFREPMERPGPTPVGDLTQYVWAKEFCVMLGSDGQGKPATSVILRMDIPEVPGPVIFQMIDPQTLRGVIADLQDALARLEAPR